LYYPGSIETSALLVDGKTADARNMLLDEGYVKRLQPEIQQAYLVLIPINPTLKVMLGVLLKNFF
jgi:hypothetical protein